MPNYSAARSQVALEALSVAPETTFTTLCPICNGGASGEKKLSVTRVHNGALFVCMRASCPGFRGFVSMDGSGSKDMQRRPAPPRPLDLATEFDAYQAVRLINDHRAFPRRQPVADIRRWGVTWAGQNRVYECRGFKGEVLGHVTRSPDKTIRTFRAREGGDMFSVYDTGNANPWVLVEDCVSAMCVASHGFSAVALLGTNVPPSVDAWLRSVDRPYSLLVWLDPDAENKSIEIAGRYRSAKAVIGYEKDPKDLPDLNLILRSYL